MAKVRVKRVMTQREFRRTKHARRKRLMNLRTKKDVIEFISKPVNAGGFSTPELQAAAWDLMKMREDRDRAKNGELVLREIHYELIERAAMLYSTHDELATMLGIGITTFQQYMNKDERLREAVERGHSDFRMRLRGAQRAKAFVERNTAMQIFLGKNVLGQRDYQSNELTGKDGGPIEIVDWSVIARNASAKLREGYEPPALDAEYTIETENPGNA